MQNPEIAQLGNVIHTATVEFLAFKHCVTIPEVVASLRTNEKLLSQYCELVRLAADYSCNLIQEGAPSNQRSH